MRRRQGWAFLLVGAMAVHACGDSHEADPDDETEPDTPSPSVDGTDTGSSAAHPDASGALDAGALDAASGDPKPPRMPGGPGATDRMDGGPGEHPPRDGGMPKPDGGDKPKPDGGPKPKPDGGPMPMPDGGLMP